MISITLGALQGSIVGLQAVSKIKLPVAQALKFSRLSKAVDAELALLNENRNKLMQEYGTAGEQPGSFLIPNDKLPYFQQEMQELHEQVVEIEGDPIPYSALEGKEFTPEEIGSLGPFLSIDKEDAP